MKSNFLSENGTEYLQYLKKCVGALSDQDREIKRFMDALNSAHAIHIFGFGRSGAAASSLAIRLRHFSGYIPPVWWMGDLVREPVREGDLVILFSKSGERPEVLPMAISADHTKANIVLFTSKKESSLGNLASIILNIPVWEGGTFYGGGDFECASYLIQELIVTYIGHQKAVPKDIVAKNHV